MKILKHTIICLGALALLTKCEPQDVGPCPACPNITSISPDHGKGGDEIIITGTNFDNFIEGTDKVTINEKEALLTKTPTATTLQVQVPSQVGSGPVVVEIGPLSSAESGNSPMFTYDVVRLDSLAPASAKMGDVITMFGAFFDPIGANNLVKFPNDSIAEVVEVTESTIKVKVPKGAGNGSIEVTVDGLTSSSPVFSYEFTVAVSTYTPWTKVGQITFDSPDAIAIDPSDNLYISDIGRIGKVNTNGFYSTIQYQTTSADDISFDQRGIDFGPDGLLYVSDYRTHKIYQIGSNLHTYAGNNGTTFKLPMGLTVDGQGIVYLADFGNHQIKKVDVSGQVETLAGNGEPGFSDGTGTSAVFDFPTDLTLDAEGNLIVTDGNNAMIRKISLDGTVTTIAGSIPGFGEGMGTEARFKFPTGVAVNNEGDIFIVDNLNHRIRQITSNGLVSTVAGNGLAGFKNGDGAEAQFNFPQDIVVDSEGNLFVTDNGNNTIRKITLE